MKTLFEGWYFKHQNKTQTLAIIPGYCKDHAFIQVITDHDSYMYMFKSLKVKNGTIYIGDCTFSPKGIVLHLPNIDGTIMYGPLHGLSSDIMGFFRHFPMECRHSVISIYHRTAGTILIQGEAYCFDDGKGYIEGDAGTSFPTSYLWLQCNDFHAPCAIMLSIATIPFYGLHFSGCICAIQYRDKEYRLATYNGVRILAAKPRHVCLLQNKLLLEIDIHANGKGFPLRSPKIGQMSNTIYESSDASVHVRLWKNNHLILNVKSKQASFEYTGTSHL